MASFSRPATGLDGQRFAVVVIADLQVMLGPAAVKPDGAQASVKKTDGA